MTGQTRIMVVGRDGRERAVELGADGQAALYARLLHAGQRGVVEVAGATRLGDGRLRFTGRRREAADYLTAGQVRFFAARVAHHRRVGREVFASPLARERPEPTNDAVVSGQVLWVDLDSVGEDAGLCRLERLRPHLVVGSGGGLHGYWLCERELPAAELESANRRLAARLPRGGQPRAHPARSRHGQRPSAAEPAASSGSTWRGRGSPTSVSPPLCLTRGRPGRRERETARRARAVASSTRPTDCRRASTSRCCAAPNPTGSATSSAPCPITTRTRRLAGSTRTTGGASAAGGVEGSTTSCRSSTAGHGAPVCAAIRSREHATASPQQRDEG
ncbi:MAG: hypothetical protein ACRDLD_13260 [Thermoleophilaceae bacterium]